MSAFDTSSNPVSTSFTDAFGTAVLQPSDTNQYVAGFARTQDKRYYEFLVTDIGGDPSKLWLGFLDNFGTGIRHPYVFSAVNQFAHSLGGRDIAADTVRDEPRSFSYASGDTLMFAINFSGDGNDVNGSHLTGTFTDGLGNSIAPIIYDWGRNGTWIGDLISWDWPQYGSPKQATPVVLRLSTSASAATVSLRVVTNSFVYAIPTNYIAWGDGAGGAGTTSAIAVSWDPVKHTNHISITGSNQYARIDATYTFVNTQNSHHFFSTVLPTTGKRVIETFIHRPKKAGTGTLGIGLADGDATITESTNISASRIGFDWLWNYYVRGGGVEASLTLSTEGYDFYLEAPGQVLYIDLDASRYWQTGGTIAGAGLRGDCWQGAVNASGIADPYIGTDGLTFTASAPGLRLYAETRRDASGSANNVFLNAGQRPFETFPLLPGWVSMDNTRQVFGVGAKWARTTPVPAQSTTLYAGDLIFRSAGQNCFQGTTTKNAGKYFFEIFKQRNGGTSYFGLRHADATTVSATNLGLVLDQGLFFSASPARKVRYNASTLTWTASSSALSSGDMQAWYAIAVDFDNGYVWGGLWNKVDRKINWTAGADPENGIQPDLTFTASTTLRIAYIWGTTTSPPGTPVCLVAEDTNVIGSHTNFDTWNGTNTLSATMTPSGTSGGGGILWPYGVMT